jgi:hypothetical protein
VSDLTILDADVSDETKKEQNEAIDLARRAREAAEREIRDRSEKEDSDHQWVTEKRWQSS